MNWEVAGVLIEGAGAMAVVVSLIYLARQMRQGTELGRASYHIDQQSNYRGLILSLVENADLNELFLSGLRDPDALSWSDYARFTWLMGEFVQQYQVQLEGARPGLTSEDDMASWGRFIGSLLKEPGGARYWREARGLFKAEVADSLDAAMQRTRPLSEIMPRVFESGQATD